MAEAMERVLTIGVKRQIQSEENFHSSLNELVSLSDTAGGTVVSTITQNREKIHRATYMGEGKIEEIKQAVEELDIDLVISNDELSPGQLRNLSNYLDVRLIDRSQLILDIFAQRAHTKEGKLQVELAQLEYLLPRLRGKGIELSRLGAGIGTRGPGETKLETDQRHIRGRIHEIKRRLQLAVKQREQYRKRRKTNEVFQIALVGYTNAGKSTIFNRLTDSGTLEEDRLFATLDPLTRQIDLPSGFQALLTDTVGFLQDLPTSLIAAFRSTLEEAAEADLIVHVVDGAHPDSNLQQKTVLNLLNELKAESIPRLTVYNKRDRFTDAFIPSESPHLIISAYDSNDIEALRNKMEDLLKHEWSFYRIELAPDEGRNIDLLERETIVTANRFDEENGKFILQGYMKKDHPLKRLMKEQ